MIDFTAPQIDDGWDVSAPPSFSQTRDLRLLVCNGLRRPVVYDPLSGALDAGIIAPSAPPTVTTPGGGGATEGTYYIGVRYKDNIRGTYSSLSPLAEVEAAEDDQFSYAGIPVSDESRVTHVEIWRTTAGELDQFYLIGTVTNGTTTLTGDTDDDDTLGLLTDDYVLDLETADRQLWARRQGLPPNYMRCVFQFQDRAFYCALATYDTGTVSVSPSEAPGTPSGYTVAGTLTPDATGLYTLAGNYHGISYFTHDSYYLWAKPFTLGAYYIVEWWISTGLGVTSGDCWHGPGDDSGPSETLIPWGTATGTATVTFTEPADGGWTITGSGTSWTSALDGRKLYMIGADREYTILSVSGATSLTLSEEYTGDELSGVRYAIMADPKMWGNTLIWSEQGECEYVPATQNTIGVQESLPGDNDYVVGGIAHGTQAWILKTRHVYSLTFARQPKIDPGVHLRFDRGAFNHRCADYLVDTLYLMDALGPWAIGPGDTYIPLGPPIQDYFRDSRVDFGKREWWFVSCSPSEKVVRFFVTLEGQTGITPKTALCYGIEIDKWWTETYQEGCSGSTRVDHLGRVQTVVGGSYDRLLLLGEGVSEAVSCQGSVTSATATSLSDSTQSPFTSDMEGYDVTIIYGTGAGQTRTVSSCDSASKVTVSESWETNPDTTSRYALPYAIRGTATGSSANTLVDSAKTFSGQVAGATVAIISGTGSGQTRYVKTASSHTLTVTEDWDTNPSTDSVYLLGAIECTYRTGILEIPPVDTVKHDAETKRYAELIYEPTTIEQFLDWRLLWDHLLTGDESWLDYTRAGLTSERGSEDKRLNLQAARSSLATAPGVGEMPFRARASRKVLSHRFLANQLHWFAGEEDVKLYGLRVE